MKKLIVAAVIASISAGIAGVPANAKTVPCEDMLKQLRDAEKTAQLDDADKAKVAALEAKGVERCNADDDARADGFFGEALKIVAKK